MSDLSHFTEDKPKFSVYLVKAGQVVSEEMPFNRYHSKDKFSRWQTDIFLIFFQKIRFDISCKLSPLDM